MTLFRKLVLWEAEAPITPRVGMKVCDAFDPDRRGVIKAAGPQQSEVAWDRGPRQIEINDHLREWDDE